MTTAEIVRMILLDDMTRFYNSKEWKKVRADAKRRDNNECQLCKQEGNTTDVKLFTTSEKCENILS